MKGIAAAGEATDFEDALSWAELQKDVDSMLSEHVDDIHTETFNGTPYGLFQAMFHATAVRMDGDRILSEWRKSRVQKLAQDTESDSDHDQLEGSWFE